MIPNSEAIKKYWNTFSKTYSETLERYNLNSAISISNMTRIKDAKNLLEVGCGSGELAIYNLNTLPGGLNYISVDLSDEMLKIAEEKKKNNLIQRYDINHEFLQADAEKMDMFKDEQFDTVISPLCVHIVSEPDKALGEIMRVLKPGGRLGLNVLGRKDEMTFSTIVFDSFEESGIKPGKNRSVHYLGSTELLINLLEKNGFLVDFCWIEATYTDVYSAKEMEEKCFAAPRIQELFLSVSEEKREEILKRAREKFEVLSKAKTPLKIETVQAVARKPDAEK